jgi:hypothetical protein
MSVPFTDPRRHLDRDGQLLATARAASRLALGPDRTFTLQHTYATPGTYTRGDCGDEGGVGTDTVIVTVVALPSVKASWSTTAPPQRSMVTSPPSPSAARSRSTPRV